MTPPRPLTGLSPETCSSLPTRRDLLGSALAFPLSISLSNPQIIHDNTLLSQESAQGFRLLLRNITVPLLILPAARTIPRSLALRLRRTAIAGGWILVESGLCFNAAGSWKQLRRILGELFDIEIAAPFQPSAPYISFHWPQSTLVRTFEAVTPVACSRYELIATSNGIPVSTRCRIGKGGVIFLGSMLGPALAAEEREAHAIGRGILRALTPLLPSFSPLLPPQIRTLPHTSA